MAHLANGGGFHKPNVRRQSENYRRLSFLGKGSYGAALLVEDNQTNQKRVMKEIMIGHLPPDQQQLAQQEAFVLESLSHANITKYIESFIEDGRLYIVMEHADGGDLAMAVAKRRDIVKKMPSNSENVNGGYFTEDEVMRIFVQLCKALEFVHEKKLLHRDLKTQNVFLTMGGVVKLGDFGVAKSLDSTNEQAHTQIGTPYYLSPEICENRAYGQKSDVWSLGVILYELLTLRMPFVADSLPSLVFKIISAPVDFDDLNRYGRELRALARALLMRDVERRPTVTRLVKSAYFKKHMQQLLTHTMTHGDGGALSEVSAQVNRGHVSNAPQVQEKPEVRAAPPSNRPNPTPLNQYAQPDARTVAANMKRNINDYSADSRQSRAPYAENDRQLVDNRFARGNEANPTIGGVPQSKYEAAAAKEYLYNRQQREATKQRVLEMERQQRLLDEQAALAEQDTVEEKITEDPAARIERVRRAGQEQREREQREKMQQLSEAAAQQRVSAAARRGVAFQITFDDDKPVESVKPPVIRPSLSNVGRRAPVDNSTEKNEKASKGWDSPANLSHLRARASSEDTSIEKKAEPNKIPSRASLQEMRERARQTISNYQADVKNSDKPVHVRGVVSPIPTNRGIEVRQAPVRRMQVVPEQRSYAGQSSISTTQEIDDESPLFHVTSPLSTAEMNIPLRGRTKDGGNVDIINLQGMLADALLDDTEES